MDTRIQDLVNHLALLPHPEGGFFRELYRSEEKLVPKSIGESRNLSTSILFLITKGNASHLHSIASDEIWYFNEGAPLKVHCYHPEKGYWCQKIGLDITNGELPQYIVPKGTVFGSETSGDYSLVSCMVSPGFDFKDFQLYTTSEIKALNSNIPDEVTKRLTKESYE